MPYRVHSQTCRGAGLAVRGTLRLLSRVPAGASDFRHAGSGALRRRGHRGLLWPREGVLCRVGECHAATIPLQELDAEPSLELADRARERRLGDREPIGSASEVQFFRDGDEVSKLAGLEIVHVKSLLTDTW